MDHNMIMPFLIVSGINLFIILLIILSKTIAEHFEITTWFGVMLLFVLSVIPFVNVVLLLILVIGMIVYLFKLASKSPLHERKK
jgi:ABC-type antimicrobial peptide transport system permease subunit